MKVTLVTELGDLHNVDVAADGTVGSLLTAACAVVGAPSVDAVYLVFDGNALSNPTQTLQDARVRNGDVVYLTVVTASPTVAAPSRTTAPTTSQPTASRIAAPVTGSSATGSSAAHSSLALFRQRISEPHVLAQLRQHIPDIDAIVQSDSRLAELQHHMEAAAMSHAQGAGSGDLLDGVDLEGLDPDSIEAQRKIEEAIKRKNIALNMENAMEFHPESFGRVTMLYVDLEVNGKPVKAFVDSGAQATIMSPQLAEACSVTHLIDERFAGIARGVGTAKILGRVHSAQIKIGNQFLMCSFTVMDHGPGQKPVHLLFGLDMLRRFQACIDLEKNVLRINGEEVRFLAEHELPLEAKDDDTPDEALLKQHGLTKNANAADKKS